MAWKKVGSIRKSKKGNLYIKFDSDVTMKRLCTSNSKPTR